MKPNDSNTLPLKESNEIAYRTFTGLAHDQDFRQSVYSRFGVRFVNGWRVR